MKRAQPRRFIASPYGISISTKTTIPTLFYMKTGNLQAQRNAKQDNEIICRPSYSGYNDRKNRKGWP
jgi:hypothetical protein